MNSAACHCERSAAISVRGIVAFGLLMTIVSTATAKYSGGTGEPNDPYQIATAADLIALGGMPEDYDKHFILTADIDLDPNLPGRRVFDRAVIAPDVNDADYYAYYQGRSFTGFFDGNRHVIRNLHIKGVGFLGLFGQASGASISNLGLETVDIQGTAAYVAGVVGMNHGSITTSYSTGSVSGDFAVGGLVGMNYGNIASSYGSGSVNGHNSVGGLVGVNHRNIVASYSSASAGGDDYAGGLVGRNGSGRVAACYSTGPVTGKSGVGGLVGQTECNGHVVTCYSTGAVTGSSDVGGLVGNNWGIIITSSVWDMETSGLTYSGGGFGLTTAEMMNPKMLGLVGFADDPNWGLDAGRDYPRLAWEGTAGQVIPEPMVDWLDGQGTEQEPYRIDTADQLILLSRTSALWDKHFILGADIDLGSNSQGRQVRPQVIIRVFSGAFDGNGHTISHLTIRGSSYLGLFGQTGSGARVSNLGLEAVDVDGTSNVGALAGENYGSITNCYSSGAISGSSSAGGLVGINDGSIGACYSTGSVDGGYGLVGYNSGSIVACYSTATITGTGGFAGLVGTNYGRIATSYSIGGLVADNQGTITSSFWDMQISGLSASASGVGLTTSEMMDPYMVGLNGFANDPNWVLDGGRDYPKLAWEGTPGQIVPEPTVDWLDGQGTEQEPYRIDTADQLILLTRASGLWNRHFVLGADIDLDPNLPGRRVFLQAPIQVFSGIVDGGGHRISHLAIRGGNCLGLFGQTGSGARVSNLGLEGVDINGRERVGGLVGSNAGSITTSYSTGSVNGTYNGVGGLVGSNEGSITTCYSTSSVNGKYYVGGLVGYSYYGSITNCYSSGAVSGTSNPGGLVGYSYYGGIMSSVWEMDASGAKVSEGGVGLTTAEMMDPYMLGLNGFANDPNWTLDAGHDYPRLAWQGMAGQVIPEPTVDWFDGEGTEQESYRVTVAGQLILLTRASALWDRHFVLGADIDLDPNLPGGQIFSQGVIPFFSGVFDGNGHAITIRGRSLFGRTGSGARVFNLGLEGVAIDGGWSGGGLVGQNYGSITNCYSSGSVNGYGGLVGENHGSITACCSSASVKGNGGLVGDNYGSITACYSSGSVNGEYSVGGLVGYNHGGITNCYSTASVIEWSAFRGHPGGGLVGWNEGRITSSFWLIQIPEWIPPDSGGTGLTTAEMQTASTFLAAGWDFVGETANGTEDIWWIDEGKDYPRLWWEPHD